MGIEPCQPPSSVNVGIHTFSHIEPICPPNKTDFHRSRHLLNDFLEIRLEWLKTTSTLMKQYSFEIQMQSFNYNPPAFPSNWPHTSHSKSWQLIVIVTENNYCPVPHPSTSPLSLSVKYVKNFPDSWGECNFYCNLKNVWHVCSCRGTLA
jgi:hypothetical protein